MNGTHISGKLDSVCFKEEDKRICLAIEVDDVMMEMLQYLCVDVTSELQQIYQGIEFDKNFIKRIEKKMKLTLGDNFIPLQYSKEKDWILSKPLNELYSPVSLTQDNIKFGEPLKINAFLMGFKRIKEGKDFPMVGIIAECIIANQLTPCFNMTYDVNVDVIDNKSCCEKTAYIDVDYEFDFIYNEIKTNKCSRKRFINSFGKLVKKQEVYKRIAKIVLGKEITLEYDEYFGYSIWKSLIYFIDRKY